MAKTPRKYDLKRLDNEEVAREFQIKIGKAFEPLLESNTNIEELYDSFKEATNSVTREVAGYRKAQQVSGMSAETSALCEKRRAARIELIKNPSSIPLKLKYRNLNKDVKSAVKKLKSENIEKVVNRLEEDL